MGIPSPRCAGPARACVKLAVALKRQGHQGSHRMVAELLHAMGYSLQANRKTLAGTEHPDRNAQFEHLDRAVQLQLSLGEPVISVDTKKKELVGPFKNGGRELRPKGAAGEAQLEDRQMPEAASGACGQNAYAPDVPASVTRKFRTWVSRGPTTYAGLMRGSIPALVARPMPGRATSSGNWLLTTAGGRQHPGILAPPCGSPAGRPAVPGGMRRGP